MSWGRCPDRSGNSIVDICRQIVGRLRGSEQGHVETPGDELSVSLGSVRRGGLRFVVSQASFPRAEDGLRPVYDLELGEDVRGVVAHRFQADTPSTTIFSWLRPWASSTGIFASR